MEQFVNDVFGSYAGLILTLMGVCAAVCALLPAPTETSNTFYKAIYKVLNWIAMNIGKATNADDAEQTQKKV